MKTVDLGKLEDIQMLAQMMYSNSDEGIRVKKEKKSSKGKSKGNTEETDYSGIFSITNENKTLEDKYDGHVYYVNVCNADDRLEGRDYKLYRPGENLSSVFDCIYNEQAYCEVYLKKHEILYKEQHYDINDRLVRIKCAFEKDFYSVKGYIKRTLEISYDEVDKLLKEGNIAVLNFRAYKSAVPKELRNCGKALIYMDKGKIKCKVEYNSEINKNNNIIGWTLGIHDFIGIIIGEDDVINKIINTRDLRRRKIGADKCFNLIENDI